MEVTINKVAKSGWDGPGFYVMADDPDCKALWYLTYKDPEDNWSADGACIVTPEGYPGELVGTGFNTIGLRKLGPEETITIKP